MAKIVTLKGLQRELKRIREGKKVVFTNGCFDIIHAGHVKYLEKAKRLGDILVVGLNTDRSVRKIKGKGRPIVGQNDRATVLAAIDMVDYVVLFDEPTPIRLIEAIRPDVLVKGADWKRGQIVGEDFVKSHGGKVRRITLLKGRSTTDLIKKIARLCKKGEL